MGNQVNSSDKTDNQNDQYQGSQNEQTNNNNNPKQEYQYLTCPYEDETNTFIQSFSLDQKDEIYDFFQKYGVVVIKNIINDEECAKSQEEIWLDLKSQTFSSQNIDQNDISTLKNVDKFVKQFGLIGGGYPVILPQAVRNRVNPNVYKSYTAATGQNQFISAMERYGFMRPTKQNPDWKTLDKWLHIDMNYGTGKTSTYGYEATKEHVECTMQNPIKWQNDYFQGIVAIDDCTEDRGGFCVVPGFQSQAEKWKRENISVIQQSANSMDSTTVHIPKGDLMQNHIQKIPIRKGSLVIWDGRLPHCNFPNTSDKPRMVQYLKYNAVGKHITSNVQPNYQVLEQMMEDQKFDFNEFEKKILGLQQWEQ